MPSFTLTQEEYEALIALSRRGVAGNPNEQTRLDQFLRNIEKNNGVERDFLWVQWQELAQPLPPGASFPETWPPELRRPLELVTRKIAKVDVEALLESYAKEPTNVLVTRDPAARVGWTPLDAFFVT